MARLAGAVTNASTGIIDKASFITLEELFLGYLINSTQRYTWIKALYRRNIDNNKATALDFKFNFHLKLDILLTPWIVPIKRKQATSTL